MTDGALIHWLGPNILSISSPSVIPLYGVMEKSKTYQRHIRSEGLELFFKPDSTAQHRERKRLWAKMFTSTGYIRRMLLSQCGGSRAMIQPVPAHARSRTADG